MDMDEHRAMDLVVLAHCIRRGRPLLEAAVRNKLNAYAYENFFTNYFFRNDASIKLCVPNTDSLCTFVRRMDIEDMVWFGYNTDPVEVVPLDEINSGSFHVRECLQHSMPSAA